jgi:4'-phosphopantetheinyl transferase EntD
VIGSITHCHGYRAATVAWQVHFQTVGIDAEIHEPLPSGVLSHVAVAEEQAWLLEAHGGLHWDRLLFSAKESVYKAWFPITGRWLDFKDAVVTFDPIQQTFYAKITLSPLIGESAFLTDFSGRYLTYDDLVLTAITVPQR